MVYRRNKRTDARGVAAGGANLSPYRTLTNSNKVTKQDVEASREFILCWTIAS